MLKKSELRMKKRAELIDMLIADHNRIEYLKDKVHVLEEKLKGLDELQRAYEEQIKLIAFNNNGEASIPMSGNLEDYEVKVTLQKKEGV